MSNEPTDTLLEYRVTIKMVNYLTNETSRDEIENRIWLGDRAVRMDFGDRSSYIVDLRKKRMAVLSHRRREYRVVEIPFHLEDHMTGESAKHFETVVKDLDPTVTVASSGVPATVGEWETEYHHWSIETAGGAYRYELEAWLTNELSVDERLYEQLYLNRYSISVGSEWRKVFLEQEGIAVKMESTTENPRYRRETTSLLVAVRSESRSEGRMQIPADYRQLELDWTTYVRRSGSY